jgi:hypothetical protein
MVPSALPAHQAVSPTRQHSMRSQPLSACPDTCKHQLAGGAACNARSLVLDVKWARPGHPRRSWRQEQGERSFQQAKKPQDVLSSPPFVYSLRTHESIAAIAQSAGQRPCFQQSEATCVNLADCGGTAERRGSWNTASAGTGLGSSRSLSDSKR